MSPDVMLFVWTTKVVFGPIRSFRIPSYLLRKIMQEASLYFPVMVCSHIAMVVFQVLGSVRESLPSFRERC